MNNRKGESVQNRRTTGRQHLQQRQENFQQQTLQQKKQDQHLSTKNLGYPVIHSTTFIPRPKLRKDSPSKIPVIIISDDSSTTSPGSSQSRSTIGPQPIENALIYGIHEHPKTGITTTMDRIIETSNHQHSAQSTLSTNSRKVRSANAAANYLDSEDSTTTSTSLYEQAYDPYPYLCAKCNTLIIMPENHSIVTKKCEQQPPPIPIKAQYPLNLSNNIQHPTLHRNNSIGGFTLTGQDTRQPKRTWISRCCSSHKVALVVSTFSFLVTIGLTITLILMKNKGMMEPM